MSKNEQGNKWRVSSVGKAITILNCFDIYHTELNLSQISAMIDMPKSTTYNLVKTLLSEGYLRKSEVGQSYYPGMKLFELGYCVRKSLPIISYAIPVMENVTRTTGEITYLSTVDGDKLLVLEGTYPDRRFATYATGGKALPMHCCSAGKMILSTFPDDLILKIADRGLTPSTPNTICTKEDLLAEMETIRRNGYSIDNEEESLGIRCASVPIYGSRGRAVGTISISGSVRSITNEKIREALPVMEKAAHFLARMADDFPVIYPDQFL